MPPPIFQRRGGATRYEYEYEEESRAGPEPDDAGPRVRGASVAFRRDNRHRRDEGGAGKEIHSEKEDGAGKESVVAASCGSAPMKEFRSSTTEFRTHYQDSDQVDGEDDQSYCQDDGSLRWHDLILPRGFCSGL